MMRKLLYIVLLLLSSLTLVGQTVRLDARRGNKSYNRSNYSSARTAYLSSVARDSTYAPARLGLGDALYMSGDTVAAVQMWQRIASDSKADPRLQALAWHNLGNRCMDMQQYDKAIEAYKESLRRNPTDDETRYNLALAIKLNKQPPQQGGGGGGGGSQSDPSQTPPDQQPKEQPQGKEPDLDKSQADRILDALRQQEQHTRQRINQRQPQQKNQNKKNW